MAMMPSFVFIVAWLVLTLALVGGSRHRAWWGGPMPLGVAVATALAIMQLTLSLFAFVGQFGLGLGIVAAIGVVSAGLRWFTRNRTVATAPRVSGDPAALVIVAFAIVLAAPVLWRPHLSYDVLSYHLPLAERVWSRDGGQYLAGDYYSRLPLGGAVIEAPFVSRGDDPPGDGGVRFLTLMVFAACALSARDVARRLGASRAASLVATALVLTHPLAWRTLLNAYTDGLVALFALGATWWALRLPMHKERVEFPAMVGGLLVGSAIAVKFSAVGIVAIPIAALVAAEGAAQLRYRPAVLGPITRSIVLLALGAAVGCAPWWIRAWMLTGHPLHPFIGTAPGWSAEQAAFVVNQHDPRSPLALPYWRGLVEGLGVFDIDLVVGGGAVLMPVALMLACAAMFVAQRRLAVVLVLAMAVLGYAAWRTVGGAPDRFVMAPVFLVMILAAMAAWPRRAHKLWRIGAGGLLLVAWMATVIPNRDLYRVAWAGEAWSREGMVPQRFLDSVWRDVGEKDRVLLLFEARARLFPRDSEITTVWDVPPWFPLLREATDAASFERALAGAGYTHLVVNEVEWGRLVDFYGDLDTKVPWGEVSVGLRPAEVQALLRAYPPMRHAGATDAEIARLAEFLRATRERAAMVEPMGPRAELWWAPLNANPASRASAS